MHGTLSPIRIGVLLWFRRATRGAMDPVLADVIALLELERLEDAGVVDKQMYQGNPPRAEYVLTNRGRKLADVVSALHDWGDAHTDAPAEK